MNFMGDIGKIMEESGFEDISVEAYIYGPTIVSHVMRGRAYNRGVRVHKLMNEAMNRLKLEAFNSWLDEDILSLDQQQNIADKATKCVQLFEDITAAHHDKRKEVQEAIDNFLDAITILNGLQQALTDCGRASSDTFKFWDNYTSDFSQLLLDYIAATRDGKRDLQLEICGEMLPLDFQCGHINYAKWGTINFLEGMLLKEEHPEIYSAISGNQSVVYHTKRPFSGVWQDMAMEQTLNRDCGKYRHLCTKENALLKYYLTAHQKAAVAAKTKELSGMKVLPSEMHKEGTKERKLTDEEAIQAIIQVVKEQMVNLFIIEKGLPQKTNSHSST